MLAADTAAVAAGGRIGLLFGSFNPVHTGHLILAEYFATRAGLMQVWLVLSPHSPFKSEADLLPDTARLTLLQLAIAGNPHLRAEDIELGLPRPSYTIATLDALRARHPGQEFVLLMGADNLPGLPNWRSAARLLQEVDILVYPRPGTVLPPLAGFPRAQLVSAPLLDISATFVRASLRRGESVRYLVPDAVLAEIERQGYYRAE